MKRILALAISLLCFVIGLKAQNQVFAKFKIVDEKGELLKDCEVTLYQRNDIAFHKEEAKAKVKLYMDLENYYTIEVKKKGYATKRIAFDTRLNNEPLDRNVFDFYVEMPGIHQYEGLANSEDVLDYPITVIQYNENKELFDYNTDYTNHSVAAVRELKRQVFIAHSAAELE